MSLYLSASTATQEQNVANSNDFTVHALRRDKDGLLHYTQARSTEDVVYDFHRTDGEEYTDFLQGVEYVEAGSVTRTHTFAVGDQGLDYLITGSDRKNSFNEYVNPTLTIHVGDTIEFVVNTPGHPLVLKTVQGTGTTDLVVGATNQSTINGTLTWTPDSTGSFYYQCEYHNSMYGILNVVNQERSYTNDPDDKYQQFRFDFRRLTYFIDDDGYLVARLNKDYDHNTNGPK